MTEWLKTRVFGGINPGPALWVVSLGACFSFALNYIQIVFAAHQKASVQSSFSLLSNFLFLGFIYFFPNKNPDGLLRMSLLYLAAMLIASSWLIVRFFSKRQNLLPSPKWIDSTLRKRILGFGLRLFIIQLAAMIIFTTARLMVSLFVNPAEVVIYDAAFKVFSLVMMVHGLLMTTLWSSFTHAYTQQDWPWIHRTLRRLILLMVPVILGCTVLAVISPRLIGWWLGSKQVGGSMLYFLFAVMVVLSCWSNIFSYFLNGIGKIHLQFYSAIIAAAINLPLSYLFAVSFGLGISGVVFGTIASSTIFSVLGPWYVLTYLRKIHFNDTAR